ncbi:uncharacterized protein LOC120290894 [Eucalyptus grandis]|uniref:uncharacterized protein LOC120290894 n=1 Tax=Eucalyptus grandis TaxID=71139 RepID=UPI00192F0BCC|nr:uncharacterized protein LOC120290894 [Eucalyptus grandis]
MNDQAHLMNQAPMMMNQSPMMNPPPPPQVIMNQAPQLMSASQSMSQPQLIGKPQVLNQQPQLMGQSQMLSQSQVPSLNRSYKMWPQKQKQKQQQQQQQQQQQPSLDPNVQFLGSMNPGFGALKQPMMPLPGRSNWKGKKPNDKRNDPRKVPKAIPNAGMSSGASGMGYQPPALTDLQFQNRLKSRKYYPKKKFNNRFAPYAPRNTTSFIIRAKKSGGIASMVSPCPVTPAVLPTPIFSPSREVLVDMAKEEWGVDGYGSMKGLIRLRNEVENRDNEEEEDENEEENNGSSESDVEEEKDSVMSRLDHEMNRFEMVYPNYGSDYNNLLVNRVDDQDTHIAQLEEENLALRERLFLMEREMEDLRRRLNFLERQHHVDEDVNEEVVENESDNESEDECNVNVPGGVSKGEDMDCVDGDVGGRDVKFDGDAKEEKYDSTLGNKAIPEVAMEEFISNEAILKEDESGYEEQRDGVIPGRAKSEGEEGVKVVENEVSHEVNLKWDECEQKDDANAPLEKSIGDGQ